MIGTICQPKIVISDVDTLSTLPQKEMLNGLGEIIKYWVGWGNPSITQLNSVASTPGVERSQLVEIISICQKIKVDIVCDDPSETKGLRHKLNLGHTIGHAIEGALEGKLSHGQAVAVGLIAASKISAEKKILSEVTLAQITDAIKAIGLPTQIKASQYSLTRSDLVTGVNKALKLDKKSGKFVLIKNIGNLITGMTVSEKTINDVLGEIIID